MRTRPSSGTTFIELVVALAILAVLLGLAAPRLGTALDRYAARGARDALAAAVARTRIAAVAHGGASLVVDVPRARFWIESARGDTIGPVSDLVLEYRIDLAVDGNPPERLALRFDGLGIGRLVSRTFRLRRGRVETGLTLSSYGRATRW